ncbi:hypothetical protein TNCV_9691, partial [Trichonephila clavipes]
AKSPSHRKAIEGLPTIEHMGEVLWVINLCMQCQLDSSWWARNANYLLEPSPKFRMFYWKGFSSLDEKTAKIEPHVHRSEHHIPLRCSCRLHKGVQYGSTWECGLNKLVQTPSGMFSNLLQALLEEDCPNLISTAITVDKKS